MRKFRVLKQFKYRLIDGNDILFEVGQTGNTLFFFGIHEVLLRDGFIEEILPNKKPNLSDRISTEELANNLKQMTDTLNGKSENPYGRKIYLAEAFHACRNHDLCIKDSNGVIWELNGKDFYSNGADGCPRSLSVFYHLEDLIMETFEVVVKPVEEVEENWIRIKSRTELFGKIREGKRIRETKMIDENKAHAREFDTTKELKDDIWNIFGKFDSTNYFVEYLEEN